MNEPCKYQILDDKGNRCLLDDSLCNKETCGLVTGFQQQKDNYGQDSKKIH